MDSREHGAVSRDDWLSALGPVPKGYRVIACSLGSCAISFRFPLFWKVLLGACATALAIACVWLLWLYRVGWQASSGDRVPFWFVALFWGLEAVLVWNYMWVLFGRTTLRLDRDAMITETTALGRRKRKAMPREIVRSRMQQTIDKDGQAARMDWFGQVLATWAGVAVPEAVQGR